MSKRTVVPMLKELLEEFDGDRIQLVIGSSRHLLNLRTMEAKELPPKKLLQFPVRNPQDGLANSATGSDVCPDRNEREGEPHHMQRFLVTPENHLVTISSTAEAPEGGTAFDSEQQLAEVTSDWPASRLVEIWNALPGVTAIRKFKDRATALSRIWKQAQSLPPFVEPIPVEEVPAQQEAKSESGGSKKDCCRWRCGARRDGVNHSCYQTGETEKNPKMLADILVRGPSQRPGETRQRPRCGGIWRVWRLFRAGSQLTENSVVLF